jgi:hypothetical protein
VNEEGEKIKSAPENAMPCSSEGGLVKPLGISRSIQLIILVPPTDDNQLTTSGYSQTNGCDYIDVANICKVKEYTRAAGLYF